MKEYLQMVGTLPWKLLQVVKFYHDALSKDRVVAKTCTAGHVAPAKRTNTLHNICNLTIPGVATSITPDCTSRLRMRYTCAAPRPR